MKFITWKNTGINKNNYVLYINNRGIRNGFIQFELRQSKEEKIIVTPNGKTTLCFNYTGANSESFERALKILIKLIAKYDQEPIEAQEAFTLSKQIDHLFTDGYTESDVMEMSVFRKYYTTVIKPLMIILDVNEIADEIA